MFDLRTQPTPRALRMPIGTVSTAVYGGTDRRYRYLLTRSWGGVPETYPSVVWILHNPSTATEHADDPTIHRCRKYTERFGFMRMLVVNVLAYRATDKSDLHRTPDPLGPDNLRWIERVLVFESGIVIAGWGQLHSGFARSFAKVASILQASGRRINALRITKHGEPAHPLYLPRHAPLIELIPGVEPYVSILA